MPHTQIATLLERLTGQYRNPSNAFNQLKLDPKNLNLGLSQFNEMLLLLGLDRINQQLFDFLFEKPTIETIDHLERGINKLVEIALLLYGNISDAFNTLSKQPLELEKIIENRKPVDLLHFTKRHPPILPIKKIPADRTYYLGYLIERDLNSRLERNPEDKEALQEKDIRESIVEQGKLNQEAYLACDHMDVYVATSMREKHEFLLVSRIADKIFNDAQLTELNLRFFDPTQAYCKNRIDKGLSEGLMLKRAKCTIYLAQESDTLGKDSELASTLAQGKPVIAFIPDGSGEYVDDLLKDLKHVHPKATDRKLLLEQLRIFNPKLAWDNPKIHESNDGTLLEELKTTVKTYYDKRAENLSKNHPLGIQVNLANGVANGVLVVRSIDQCVKLLKAILTKTVQFELESEKEGDQTYWLLKEKISNCVFRTITANLSLSNAFWNYYFIESTISE
jgi:hypothetical protein